MNSETDTSKRDLPAGTVTFLFTDIEGSTRLLHQLGEGYVTLLADHHRLMREVFIKYNGREVDTEGDAFFVSFSRATDAVSAVVEAQRTLAQHSWPEDVTVRVRMGLHTGEPWTGGEGYVGMDVHRAARIAHVGHGGQVLLSETTTSLVIDQLPEDVTLLDLGHHRLKDMKRPEHIRQLVIVGLQADFPPLKTLGVVAEPAPLDLAPPELPAFLQQDVAAPVQPVFVGREREIGWLEDHGRPVLEVQESEAVTTGRILFVTGEAGMGKSSLLGAFARKAAEINSELLVTWGQGNAFSGQGDPYLPFREVFAQLCGDVEGPWQAGLLDSEAAGRLWTALPETAEILGRDGADLLDNFVSGRTFLRNLTAAAPKSIALQNRIRDLVDKDPYASGGSGQSRLFEQVVDVLAGVSAKRPLLIILDDLQWVDHGSVDLLFQLGRQLSGKRILIVVAYRPEDVSASRDNARHPLLPLIDELKRLFGEITLDLAGVEGKAFVDDFVDSEPNKLDRAFRDRLFRRTGGHALFTVELLRDMQERGDLIQDEQGHWIESPTLNWDNLPARVEGVIESRIGRLEESLREILTVAAVEGESFTAQVIARVQEIQERKLLRSLSRELALRHHLVNEREALLIGKQMLARYRFAHALFQRYLYNEISPVERRLLHGEIAVILEEFYGDERDTIAVQLGRHYLEAGDDEKAMKYLLLAGDRARQMSAHQEAINAYQSALDLAEANQRLERAARILMKLGQTYGLAMEPGKASELYQRAFIAWQRASAAAAVEELTLSVHPLRLEYSVPVKTLDPMMATNATLVRLLFNGLTQITLEGDVLPDVAERWEILEDGKTYTFHLRQDVYWRDGRPVTAHDFVYAWQRILHPDNNVAVPYLEKVRAAKAYNARQVTDWEEVGVHAKDDATLVIELEEPVGYFLLLLTLPALFPVPMHIVERLGEDWASSDELISNGAFFLESWPDQDKEVMTFLRNPRYHGRVVGNVGQVVLATLRQMDEAAYYSDPYESDQIDVLRLTPIELKVAEILIKRFADDHVSGPALSTMYIALDSSKPPLDDVRVRQAMAMTIDRWANVETMFEVATGGLVPPGMGGHSPGIAYEFDPEKARELLKPVGDTQLRKFSDITVLSGGPELLWAVEHWRRYLGLQLSSQRAPWSEVFDRWRADPPQIYIAAWSADYPDPDNFLRIGMSKIRQLWNHPEYEALIVEAGRELNGSRRLELYQKADRILIEEAVVIPIFYVRIHSLVKPWIHNWSLPTFTATRLENVIIEPH